MAVQSLKVLKRVRVHKATVLDAKNPVLKQSSKNGVVHFQLSKNLAVQLHHLNRLHGGAEFSQKIWWASAHTAP